MRFGCKQWVPKFLHDFRRYSHARIREGDLQVIAALLARDRKRPCLWHRVSRVGHDVHENPPHLINVSFHFGFLLGQVDDVYSSRNLRKG